MFIAFARQRAREFSNRGETLSRGSGNPVPRWVRYGETIYYATVRNRTVWIPSQFHNVFMLHKKNIKAPDSATHASVKKELAKPRMAKSARIAELNLDVARIPEQPSTLSGTVDKIIPSPRPSQPKMHRLLSMGPTTGLKISVSKIH
jgi:hypothetical protein